LENCCLVVAHECRGRVCEQVRFQSPTCPLHWTTEARGRFSLRARQSRDNWKGALFPQLTGLVQNRHKAEGSNGWFADCKRKHKGAELLLEGLRRPQSTSQLKDQSQTVPMVFTEVSNPHFLGRHVSPTPLAMVPMKLFPLALQLWQQQKIQTDAPFQRTLQVTESTPCLRRSLAACVCSPWLMISCQGEVGF
jgi:hypothetical protein